MRAVERLARGKVEIGLARSAYARRDVEDVGSEVALLAEAVGDEARGGGELVTVGAVAAMVMCAGRDLIHPDVEAGAARGADWRSRMELGEARALRGKAIHVGRVDAAIAVA